MKSFALALVLAATALTSTPTIVLAANAVITRDADVFRRATGDRVVNEVEEDQLVTVTDCERRRCFVRIPGPDGWVNRNRIDPIEYGDPGYKPGVTFNFGGGGFGISIY
jgi:SH3-like domain-containing protein